MDNINRSQSIKESARERLFFRLYMTNQKNLYSFILARTGNCDVTDDIIQETIAVMWEKFDQFDIGTNFTAWGIGIARRQVLKYYNQLDNKVLRFNDKVLEILDELSVQRESKITDHLEILRKCLGKLSDNNRHLLQLKYDQDLNIKSIAKCVGRPVQGMYKAMSRIHNALLHCVKRGINQQEGALGE